MTTTVDCTAEMHVLHARVARLDVHKMQITASLDGPGALTQWLASHRVTAASMGGAGIFWKAHCEALEEAGIEPLLLHAQFVKQVRGLKSDLADSLWLARICQFGLCRPSYLPLRQLSRYRPSRSASAAGCATASTRGWTTTACGWAER